MQSIINDASVSRFERQQSRQMRERYWEDRARPVSGWGLEIARFIGLLFFVLAAWAVGAAFFNP